MAVSLATVPAPQLDSDAHSVSSLTNMLSVMNKNFIDLQNAFNAREASLNAQAVEYLTNIVPSAAKQGDKWFQTDNADPTLSTSMTSLVCMESYSVADGLNISQKEAKWKLSRDTDTLNQVNILSGNLDGLTTTYQSDNPPSSIKQGDTWIDTNVGEKNQAYTGIDAYDYSGNTPFTSPTGTDDWTQAEIDSHFRLSGDKSAQALAGTANSKIDGSNTDYFRALLPGTNGVPDNGLSFSIGDGWNKDEAPEYQSYVCYLGYATTDVSSLNASLIDDWISTHWRAKGDKTGRDAAIAAQATADGKIENFRQLVVPAQADILDTWYKNDGVTSGNDQLFICDTAYTNTFITDGYISAGFSTENEYRESLWSERTDKGALDKAKEASDKAGTKTADYYNNTPPSVADKNDKWIDKSQSPIITWVNVLAYDFSAESSVVWDYNGTSTTPATPSVPVYWESTTETASNEIALQAKTFVDGQRTNFIGISPPSSSLVTGVDVKLGDSWVKISTDPSISSGGNANIKMFSTFSCYKEYTEIIGLDFVGTGYSSATGNDGVGNQLAVGDVGFTTGNAYNYWQQSEDPRAQESALDIEALKDGKRNTFISNSLATDGIPNRNLENGTAGIGIGDIWIDEGSVNGVNGATETFQVYKCKLQYSIDGATPNDRFDSIDNNWLAVSEPVMRAQAIFRRSMIDGKRSIYVHNTVPNAGGPTNWNTLEGAKLGDLWFDNTSSPASKYWCKTPYITNGTIANWENMDSIPAPIGQDSAVTKQYLEDQYGATSGIANLVGGKIPIGYIPSLAIVNVFSVADDTARDALTVEEGDVAIVTSSASNGSSYTTYIRSSVSTWIIIEGGLVSRISTLETADTQNVKLTGTQTVAGAKTFSSDLTVEKNTPQLSVKTGIGTSGYLRILDEDGNAAISLASSKTTNLAVLTTGHVDTALDVDNKLIRRVKDPASEQDAATKAYVDGKVPNVVTQNANSGTSSATVSFSVTDILNKVLSAEIYVSVYGTMGASSTRYKFVKTGGIYALMGQGESVGESVIDSNSRVLYSAQGFNSSSTLPFTLNINDGTQYQSTLTVQSASSSALTFVFSSTSQTSLCKMHIQLLRQ